MSFTELLEKVEELDETERKELLAVLLEAEKQDKQKAIQSKNGNNGKPKSFTEVAGHLIGSIKDGLPTDLSTNKEYLKDMGRD